MTKKGCYRLCSAHSKTHAVHCSPLVVHISSAFMCAVHNVHVTVHVLYVYMYTIFIHTRSSLLQLYAFVYSQHFHCVVFRYECAGTSACGGGCEVRVCLSSHIIPTLDRGVDTHVLYPGSWYQRVGRLSM